MASGSPSACQYCGTISSTPPSSVGSVVIGPQCVLSQGFHEIGAVWARPTAVLGVLQFPKEPEVISGRAIFRVFVLGLVKGFEFGKDHRVARVHAGNVLGRPVVHCRIRLKLIQSASVTSIPLARAEGASFNRFSIKVV